MYKKVENIDLLEIIGNEILRSPLFQHYQITKQEIQHIKSPSVFTSYDTTLVSFENNRWLFVRVEDYYKYQKTVLWVNFLDHPKPVNFDLEKYFYEQLKIRNANQKFTFKAPTSIAFQEGVRNVLDFINTNMDKNGLAVLKGNYWLDMPFDWSGYK